MELTEYTAFCLCRYLRIMKTIILTNFTYILATVSLSALSPLEIQGLADTCLEVRGIEMSKRIKKGKDSIRGYGLVLGGIQMSVNTGTDFHILIWGGGGGKIFGGVLFHQN